MHKMIAERYMIVTSLGEGGMADVYLAIDTILNREVAIKILRGELGRDPVALLRFQREANAVSKLNHPNVVDVYDVGEFEGRHYIVMEYIRGRTLKQLISQRGALHCEEAVNIMIQLTSAVEHAHENNIIHRDIKPQNVLVKDDGTVKITDFGIALAHDAVQLTQSDAVLGSAHYLAPETTRGEAPTNQVDIYALGIVFYELLSGSVPFNGENPVQIAMKHLREELPSIKEFNPTLPQSVENIIMKATVKNRSLRYQNAKEMLHDLDVCLLDGYRDVDKLLFEEENDPTIILDKRAATPIQQHADEQEAPKKEEEERKAKKGDKRRKTVIVSLIILIAALATAAIVILGGFLKQEKLIVVPDVINVNERDALQTLKQAGFDTSKIIYKEELDASIEKGNVISIEPDVGSESNISTEFTITLSKGISFLVEDYTNQSYTEVAAKLNKEFPKLHIHVEYQYDVYKKAGYIVEQKGLEKGAALDREKEADITFVVTAKPTTQLKDIVGRDVSTVKQELENKGFVVITNKLPTNDMSEEELAEIKHNVVIKSDPEEGTQYTQEGDASYIMLYYYE